VKKKSKQTADMKKKVNKQLKSADVKKKLNKQLNLRMKTIMLNPRLKQNKQIVYLVKISPLSIC